MAKNIQRIKLRYGVLLNMMPIMGLILIYTTTLLQSILPVYIPLALTMFWIIQTAMLTGSMSVYFNYQARWWLLYYLLGFLMSFLGFATAGINFQIAALPTYMIPIMGFFILRYYNRKEIQILISFFLIIFVGNLSWNIFLDYSNPELFESLTSSEESRELAIMMNLTGTPHNILCLWGIGTLWMCIINLSDHINKLLLLSVLVLLTYFMLVVDTRGTTTLLIGFLVIGFVLAHKEPLSLNNRKRYYRFSIVILCITLIFIITPLLAFVVEHIDSERLSQRLNDVLTLSSTGNINDLPDGSFAQRIAFSQISLRTFLANPLNMLIGIGEQAYSVGDDLYKVGIGQHSEFIDVLARHGILGALIYYKIVKSYIGTLHSLSNDRNIIKYVDVLFVLIIIYGFLNYIFKPLMLIFLYILYPSSILLLNAHCNEK